MGPPPRLPNSWMAPAATHDIRGLGKRRRRSFRFANFIRRRLLIRAIQLESLNSEFAQASFLSFRFSLSVPS